MVLDYYLRFVNALIIFLVLISPLFAAIQGDDNYSGLDPQYLKMKVYKLAVSEDQYCQSPVVIFENDSPTLMNMIDMPNIGGGVLSGGTYQCIMIEISDTVIFASNASEGGCTLGQEEITDICSDTGTSFQLIEDRNTKTCSGSEQRIALFFSTASANESSSYTGNGFMAPIDSNLNLGYKQNTALLVDAALTLRLVSNGNSRIDDRFSACEMQLPLFELRKL